MLEVVYYVACSLDGFIADREGGLGWLAPFEGGDEDYGYASFYASVDAVLMGRATFDFCRALPEWPYAGKAARVFSRSAIERPPHGTLVVAGPPSAIVDSLESGGHRRAYLVGGGLLAASFRDEGLVSGYIVSVVPVILGGGTPMIAPGRGVDRPILVGSRAFDSGIVQNEYRCERDNSGGVVCTT